MPLGNYTSQFFANVYLGELDQFVKHDLKAKHYIRYVDDFIIFSRSKQELLDYKNRINLFLKENLNISLHPDKSRVMNLNQGIPFLGFRIFYHQKIPTKSNRRKFEVKLKELKILYHEDQIKREEVIECLEGWMAYAKQGDTYSYRRNLLKHFNKNFPIKDKKELVLNKKITNFFRKVYASKGEFSTQKTLLLLKKRLSIENIAYERGLKIGTIWEHIISLIGHGQIPIWVVLPRKKIVYLLRRIKNLDEPLKQIKKRIYCKRITFDEIACVKAHLKMKEKVRKKNRK